MAFEFLQVQASEWAAVRQFLIASFNATAETSAFRPDVLKWKYFSAHPEWTGSRSFVEQDGAAILAHGGVWPVCFITPTAEIKAINLIDWAASPSVPGIGVLLLRKVAGMADVMLAIGGSEHTQQILPKLGYQRRGELRWYAKVIRPWQQYRTTPSHNWKAPLRLCRNVIWSRGAASRPSRQWRAERIVAFAASMEDAIIRPPTTAFTSCRRTISGLNHLLQCPAGRFSAFLLLEGERIRGYFLICQVGGQARLADIWVNEAQPEGWHAACFLAAATAAEDPATCEIVAASSIDVSSDGFVRAGFRLRRRDPLNCYDPHECLGSAPPLNVNLADGDLCFLSDPSFPYLT